MKEVLAERDKSAFAIITVLGLVGLIAGIVEYFVFVPSSNNPNLAWLPILVICVGGFVSLIGIISLCFPNSVIVKQGETLTIYNGFRGIKKVNLSDVIVAKVQPLPSNAKPCKNGNIILTVKTEQQEKDVVVINVKDKAEAVEKINSVINNG